MRVFALFSIALGLVACTSSTESSPTVGSGHGTCVQRDSGSYVVHYTARSGDCGEQAETVMNPGPEPTEVKSPCSGAISYSSDNCEVTYNSTCPADSVSKGGKVTVTGKSKWSTDGSTGTATEAWSITDASGRSLCQGTYDVTITRQ